MFWALNCYVGDLRGGMRLMGHVLCMGRNRNVYRVWFRNLNLGDHLEDRGVDERIILKWIFKEVGWEIVDDLLMYYSVF